MRIARRAIEREASYDPASSGDAPPAADIPGFGNKPDAWLHSFKQAAILSHDKGRLEAADRECHRHGRQDVVLREKEKFEFA